MESVPAWTLHQGTLPSRNLTGSAEGGGRHRYPPGRLFPLRGRYSGILTRPVGHIGNSPVWRGNQSATQFPTANTGPVTGRLWVESVTYLCRPPGSCRGPLVLAMIWTRFRAFIVSDDLAGAPRGQPRQSWIGPISHEIAEQSGSDNGTRC